MIVADAILSHELAPRSLVAGHALVAGHLDLTMLRRHLVDAERSRDAFAHGRAVREHLDG